MGWSWSDLASTPSAVVDRIIADLMMPAPAPIDPDPEEDDE